MAAPVPTADRARPLILHVVFRFDVGGLENGVVNLINQMPSDRWRHGVLALTEVSAAFRARVQRDDVTYHALAKQGGHLFMHYGRLHRLFRELRPAVVHTRNLAALEATVPAWTARVPVRIHGEHGWDVSDLDGSNRKHRLIRRLYRPFVGHYVALSRDLERYLEARVGVPASRIAQIYNGVDTARFSPAPAARPPIAGCPFGDPGLWLMGTVGRMHAVKDQLTLARAFVRARQLAPKAARRLRLAIVGDGPARPEVERLLKGAGALDHAWLPGERADVADILRGLDCFVLPSLSEGVSNTILEAMATGLPVVATRVGGNPELIEDGLSGRLVAAANPDALAEALIGYFQDPATARRHAKAARAVAESRFSLTRMASDYAALYERLLQGPGAVSVRLSASR
jgi:sugar transferase (PEP-CTERM/EpsH1 system associated)